MTEKSPINYSWTECPDCCGDRGYFDDYYDGGPPSDWVACLMCEGMGSVLEEDE